MKNQEPQHNQLNKQSIKDAAAAALHDLQLDVEAKSVSADGDSWCIQFTAEYSRFCDTFHDQFGKPNSFELVREKVKRHILKQQQNKIRAGVRIRRGKAERPAPPPSLFETTVKAIEGIASQTAAITGEIVSQASSLPETALRTLDEAATAVRTIVTQPSQPVESARQQPLARVTVKATAGKAKRKRSAGKSKSVRSSSARKASSKKAPAAKKTSGRKKRATAKSTSRPSRKRGGTKKSAGRK
jgi:hypothetical protein